MGKITAAITGVGEYLPDYILTNEELSTMKCQADLTPAALRAQGPEAERDL